MTPEPPKRPTRPGSSPELPSADRASIEVDKTVGAAKGYAASQDHVRPELARKGTLPGIPVPRTSTLTGLVAPPAPGSHPPAVPLEYAPTKRPPLPWGKTVRAPSPPPELAAMRRTPIPPPDDPPTSQSAADGQLAAVLAERDRLQTELAKAQRDARAGAEAKLVTYPPKVEQRSVSPAPSSADSIRPDGTIASLRKAQTRLYLALAAFIALAAVPTVGWLQAAAEAKARSQSADVRASAASSAADSAKATASNADKEIAKLRDDFRQYRANMREVFRLQGIDLPKRAPDDPDANDLKPVTPYCPKGKVCSGPQLVLQVAP